MDIFGSTYSSDSFSDLLDPVVDRPEPDRHLAREATHYSMNHPRRGVAALFNQEMFYGHAASARAGSQLDCVSLQATFTRLGFEVEIFRDLTLAEIVDTLQGLTDRDHSNCDCFALVFMTHGLEGKLRAKDKIFDVNLLWDSFTAERCATLVNKPKLFFIQACQGSGRAEGVYVGCPEEVTEPRVQFVPRYILPDRADFLVSLSTIPGFVSWRSPVKGSWYIQVLCRHLDRHGFTQDLLTLLTHVGREVALECAHRDPFSGRYSLQLPSLISMLIRVLQFTRKGVCRRKEKRKRAAGQDPEDHEQPQPVRALVRRTSRTITKSTQTAVKRRRK